MNTEDSTDSPDTPDTPKPAGRRRTPLVVASMAAAVLLAGGGAAYWAASAAGGAAGPAGAPAHGSPPPLTLDDRTGGAGGSIAVGEPGPNGSHYKVVGTLPGGPGSAPVYRPQGEVGKQAVERLAKALDVAGNVRSDGTTWKVGGQTQDARGPSLEVNKSGSGAWTYRVTPGRMMCPLPASGGAAGTPGCPSYRGGADAGASPGDGGKGAVSEEKAEAAARPVLAALGQQNARLDARGLIGAVRTVRADPVVGGLPTLGWQSAFQVGADGKLVGGSGQLAQPVKGADYPVLSAQKTLDRTNAGGGRTPAEVTGAVFGLSAQYADGGQMLVPSWLYTVRRADAGKGQDATSTMARVAVDPKYLRQPDGGPQPSGKPGGMTMRLERYAVSGDGTTLTVHFWGGVCSTYDASAQESATAVRIKVTGKDTHPGQMCVKIAKDFTKTVTLRQPLDGRKVVDVTSGAAVPEKP
ncbi:membrane protein [Streptomyces albospinus]|uniref:Membrane protein n=1 Tax=Streptomyces albospinus TaxID=285515 RepID=A0ABQ2UU74_9ACTN|nr:hypothetical protein [Streptomyces albospinus]GGU53777.1 membrane protein [Streptomyces albospinus]